jgi:hypothetical protein
MLHLFNHFTLNGPFTFPLSYFFRIFPFLMLRIFSHFPPAYLRGTGTPVKYYDEVHLGLEDLVWVLGPVSVFDVALAQSDHVVDGVAHHLHLQLAEQSIYCYKKKKQFFWDKRVIFLWAGL